MASAAPSRRDLPVGEARAALKQHFNTYQGENYAEGWSKLWEKGEFLPWDRGLPSPALIDTLINHKGVVGTAMVDGRRKKALVPGCGRGVDVLLLQSIGYDAVGLEISLGAVKACLEYAKENDETSAAKDERIGKGTRTFVHGDFYKNDWFKDAGMDDGDAFDLIYDYTVSFLPSAVISKLTLLRSSVPWIHR